MADPTYGVMNAEGGIYWRSGPDWNTPEAVSGNGFYPNTVIAVHCYQSGAGNVPGSTDSMWEQASDVGGSGYGSGWINEHFINDGQPINQPSPGVPPCGSAPPGPAPGPAPAAGLVFTVFNAEGGIYYRNSAEWSNTTKTPGVGVYNGDQVELICGALGDSVGPYNDRAWSKVRNLSRPGIGEGWVNEHFINDGAPANAFVPGEPSCGASSQGGSSYSPGGSLYFSPYNGPNIKVHYGPFGVLTKWVPATSPATYTADVHEWHPSGGGSCPDLSSIVPPELHGDVYGGKLITTLAAWSVARSAPLLFLEASEFASQVHYILLFDPGDLEEYASSTCPKRMYQRLAFWLGESKTNRLVVLAGQVTADYENPINGHAHAGIQNYLFPSIRDYPNVHGRNIRQQVVVCNYDEMSHEDVWMNFKGAMNQAPITLSTCPKASPHEQVVSWNP
ncbi:MAG TPA: hypothetical protein VII45_05825 [Solirubrobacterales bacterium]